jgi:cell wall-associated NlpC family hydrolase
MPVRLSTLTAIAALILALAPSAFADWHGPSDHNYPPAPGGQNWDGPDTPSGGPGPTQAPTLPAPAPPTGPPAPGSSWNPYQGDPQGPDTNSNPQSHDPWSHIPALPVSKTPTVAGKTAMIRRNGKAAVPTGAPRAVRAIITAANQIIGKPYKWGGGHGRLFDSGYDCSGSVSYALIRAGLLSYPMVSGTLAHWGARGAGKYVTIYANKGHVYMEVAGLRLDTSGVGDPTGKGGVRWRPPIGKRFGFAVRHIPGL